MLVFICVLGLPKNLAKVSYHDVKVKFGSRVTEEVLHLDFNSLMEY